MSETWLWMSAADLGRGIGEGRIDPVALTQTYLDAIDVHPLRDRIYARVTAGRALAEARSASERARSGRRKSPLDGVPVSWKDLFDTAGIATEAGSALLEGRVPDRDAAVLQNATAAGLVCLGKTHMSELAFSGLGYNPVTASSPCVNDPDAVAGGSSSGAAASVAFGLAAAGIGSDTGGSVRIPAAWNDLVGLKTTSGRLSLEGVVPLAPSFDTVGPICRTVEDAGLLLAVLEGDDPAPDLAGVSPENIRFLIPANAVFDNVRPGPKNAFEAAVKRLQTQGVSIERHEIDCIEPAFALSPILFATEAYGIWKDLIEAQPGKMFPQILERFRAGGKFLGADFVKAWRDLEVLRAEWIKATAGYDAVILPTVPSLPPKTDRLGREQSYYVNENLMALHNTRLGNLMGLASLTLPTRTPSAGFMLMTPPMTENRLLKLGAAVEGALA